MEDIFAPQQKTVSRKTPQVASPETAEVFSETMRTIRLREKEHEAQQQAATFGVPYINLVGFLISSETLVVLTEEQAQQFKAICFYAGSAGLRVGSVDPSNPELVALVQKIAKELFTVPTVYLIWIS